jgi:hypothetical protein
VACGGGGGGGAGGDGGEGAGAGAAKKPPAPKGAGVAAVGKRLLQKQFCLSRPHNAQVSSFCARVSVECQLSVS